MSGIISTVGAVEGALIDVQALTDALTVEKFAQVVQALLPLVATAVLVGFLFYVVRWGISLFRGV